MLYLTMAHNNPPISSWLFGPVHVVPALTALSCRSSAYKWLGKRKLDEAPLLDAQEGRRLEPHQHRGNLPEIEAAILNRLALDACVLRTGRDDYSLLHLTVMNGLLVWSRMNADVAAMATAEISARRPPSVPG